MGGAPALPLAGARLHEAAFVSHRKAGLTGRTVGAARLTVEAAGFRSTPQLPETKLSGQFLHFTVTEQNDVHFLSSE